MNKKLSLAICMLLLSLEFSPALSFVATQHLLQHFSGPDSSGEMFQAQNSTKVSVLLRRQKRSWGSFFMVAQGAAAVSGIVGTGLAVGDYVSGGAMYYPSINDAKAAIRRHERELRSLKPIVERTVINMRKKKDDFVSARDSFKGWGNVVKILERLKARMKRSGAIIDEAAVLDGTHLPDQDPVTWDRTVTQDAIFYTGIGASVLGNVVAIGHFAYVFRQATILKAQAMPYYLGGIRYVQNLPTEQQAMVGEFIGPSVRQNMREHYQQHLKTTMGKIMFGFAVLSTCLVIVNIGLSVDAARNRRDDLITRKNKISNVITDTRNAITEMENLMEEMDDNLQVYADTTVNFMRSQGFVCSINKWNVASSLASIHSIWSELSILLTSANTADETLKSTFQLIWTMSNQNAQQFYRMLMISHSQHVDLIISFMKEKGVSMGEWGAFQPFGSCSQECGVYRQKARRSCVSGPCYGNTEKTVRCNTSAPVDRLALQACVDDPNTKQHRAALLKLEMELLLPSTCRNM